MLGNSWEFYLQAKHHVITQQFHCQKVQYSIRKSKYSWLSGEFELSRLMFYCIKFTRIWSSYTLKRIRVRFHHPFATTTTVMSPVNKKEPINGFPCILNFPVHIGTIYKLTLISSFIIWVQSNLDYPDSLGPDEIVRIIENMNINEEQNWLN